MTLLRSKGLAPFLPSAGRWGVEEEGQEETWGGERLFLRAWAGQGPQPTGPCQQWPVVEGGGQECGRGSWAAAGRGRAQPQPLTCPGSSHFQASGDARTTCRPSRGRGGLQGTWAGRVPRGDGAGFSPGQRRATEGRSLPGARVACDSMKKNQTVQGTFSKIFGKKHANPNSTSLYVTNPPWIFTQEAPEEGTRGFGKCALGRGWRPPPRGGGRRRSPCPAPGFRRDPGRRGRDTLEPVNWPGRSCQEGRWRRSGRLWERAVGGEVRARRGPSQWEGGVLCGPSRILVSLPTCLFSLLAGS